MRLKSIAVLTLLCLMISSGVEAHHARNEVLVKVYDTGGVPLKRACVTLVPKAGEIIFRNADGKGVVTLKDIPPGNYRVTAKVEGFVAEKQQVTVGESGTFVVTFSLDSKS